MPLLEQQIREKNSNSMEEMKQQVKEVDKGKEQIEHDINANFQLLEDDMRSKMDTISKTNQHLNSLEQYTPKKWHFESKNRTRIIGKVKQSKLSRIISEYKSRKVTIEIAHRAGEFHPKVTEYPTSKNAVKVKALNQLRKDNKIKSVWTVDGKIRVKKLTDTIASVSDRNNMEA